MTLTSGLFTSLTDQWATPTSLFKQLDEEFHFSLDVCADESNHKCGRYYDKEADGLSQQWAGVCWMNPPYGRVIGDWMEKAYESSLQGATVVCLIPSRTDTRWWHDYAMRSDEIRFVKARIKFGDSGNPAPFPSAIVVFRPHSVEKSEYSRISAFSQETIGD